MLAVCKGCGKQKVLKLHVRHSKRCAAYYSKEKPRNGSQADENLLLDEEIPDGSTNPILLCDANSIQFHEEMKHQMLDALNSWTTKAMLGEKWKLIVKHDVQRGIDTAVAAIGKELVKECGEAQGGALAAVVRDRLQLFAGLQTERQELMALRRRLPPFEMYTRKVGSAPGDLAYCTVIADWLDAKMKMDTR